MPVPRPDVTHLGPGAEPRLTEQEVGDLGRVAGPSPGIGGGLPVEPDRGGWLDLIAVREVHIVSEARSKARGFDIG
jgi:hypothetical protein